MTISDRAAFYIKWAVALLLVYVVWLGVLYFKQNALLFHPSNKVAHYPPLTMKWQEVTFPNDAGHILHGWWLETEGAEKTVLFFNGNAGNVSHRMGYLFTMQKLGFNALVFDYRGFGQSAGAVNREADLYHDGRAALRFLQDKKELALSDIIFWGQSLGTAVAIDLAQNQDIAALILEAPLLSLPKLAATHYPFIPTKLLLRYDFASAEKITNIASPTLIIASVDDEIVPFAHSQALFDLAPDPKTFVEAKGTHNRIMIESTKDIYKALYLFFQEHFSE